MILERGAPFYRDFGMGRSRGTLPMQLAGNIKHGGLVERAFGMTLRELLYDFGGGTLERPADPRGPGRRAAGRLPARIAVRHAARLRGLRRDQGHARPRRHRRVRRHRRHGARRRATRWNSAPIESCGKCTPCRIGSTRGVEVIDRLIAGEDAARSRRRCCAICARRMTYGSLCALGGLTPYPGAVGALNHFPEDFAKPAARAPPARAVPESIRHVVDRRTGLTEPRSATARSWSRLTIDGARSRCPQGTSVMRAAADAGAEDPQAVRHRQLEAFGSCRLCLVQIEGMQGTSRLVHDAGRAGHEGHAPRTSSSPTCAAA